MAKPFLIALKLRRVKDDKESEMGCEICGRSSCIRSFHSLDEQEKFDNPKEYYKSIIDKLKQENEYWKNELKKSNDINSELMVVQLQLEQENETLVNNIVKIGDIAQEQDEYVERLRGLLKECQDLFKNVWSSYSHVVYKIREELEEK